MSDGAPSSPPVGSAAEGGIVPMAAESVASLGTLTRAAFGFYRIDMALSAVDRSMVLGGLARMEGSRLSIEELAALRKALHHLQQFLVHETNLRRLTENREEAEHG